MRQIQTDEESDFEEHPELVKMRVCVTRFSREFRAFVRFDVYKVIIVIKSM